MILLIDNYDSFTYNLYQYMAEINADIVVKRNDEISIEEIKEMNPDAIVLSPGPGQPSDSGVCPLVVETFGATIPILGICLGHQIIAEVFGAKVGPSKTIKHGKVSHITHCSQGIFSYMTQPLPVMRYHSLAIEKGTLPDVLEEQAIAMDDQTIMAIKHRLYPIYGLQFHPESIGTTHGKDLIRNFFEEIRRDVKDEILS
jgi:anthranilate synthase component 2